MRGVGRLIGGLLFMLALALSNVAAQETATHLHVVQTGETLAGIAANYGVELDLIARVNNITDIRYVRTGQELIVPLEGTNTVPELAGGEPGAKTQRDREIVVVLSTQTAYAYENGVLVNSVTVSSGAPGTPTVRGKFRVYMKIASKTLSGDGYEYENVQWLLYFYQGYAIHGAYWHNNFGIPVSHGCVNMTNADAEWFFNFAEVGTPVTVIK